MVLYDRINIDDWVTGGTLTFSDASTVAVGELFNDGSATVILLITPKLTTSIKFTATSVASSTENVGLAEFQAYGTLANSSLQTSSVSSYVLIRDLRRSSCDAILTSSSCQSSASPTTASSASLSTSTASAPTSTATIIPSLSSTASYSAINLAYYATISASTQDTPDDSLANRVADGVFGGYLDNGLGDQVRHTYTCPNCFVLILFCRVYRQRSGVRRVKVSARNSRSLGPRPSKSQRSSSQTGPTPRTRSFVIFLLITARC